VNNIVNTYDFDGLRVDTVPEVHPTFWADFQSAAGIYAVGEVFNGDIGYCANYQNYLDGILNYPMFFTLRNVFQSKQSMYQIRTTVQSEQSSFSNVNLLGTFVDNHDNPRFLNGQSDYQLYKNALTYVLTGLGIPIIYYGTEQGFNGGNDPNCRESLWPDYNTGAELYLFLQTIVNFKNQFPYTSNPQVERYAADNFYAYTRGNAFVALTNVGSGNGYSQNVTYQPYSSGTTICNIFYPTSDCLVINGFVAVVLDNGESKIFYPQSSLIEGGWIEKLQEIRYNATQKFGRKILY